MIELLLFLILLVLVVKCLPGLASFLVSTVIVLCALIGAIVLYFAIVS